MKQLADTPCRNIRAGGLAGEEACCMNLVEKSASNSPTALCPNSHVLRLFSSETLSLWSGHGN